MAVDIKKLLGIAQNVDLNNVSLASVLASVGPKIVITAPNGQKLYLDVAPDPNTGDSASTPLWPAGFSVGLKTGAVPSDPMATASPAEFFLDQSPVIITAPGPLGITWGTWVVFLVAIIAFPFLTYHVFKK